MVPQTLEFNLSMSLFYIWSQIYRPNHRRLFKSAVLPPRSVSVTLALTLKVGIEEQSCKVLMTMIFTGYILALKLKLCHQFSTHPAIRHWSYRLRKSSESTLDST